MATVRKLESGKWQVIVRRTGHSSTSQTFASRSECDKWARCIEADMDRGAYTSLAPAQTTTMGDLIDRYIKEVSPLKRSCKSDTQRLNFLRNHFGHLSVAALRSKHISQWRDQRLGEGKSGSTIVKEIGSLAHLIDVAMKDWNISIPSNPARLVRKPKIARGRDRRPTRDELAALKQTKIAPMVTLAIETGMRLGELLSLEWGQIDLDTRIAILPITKNGDKRTVPLSTAACNVLRAHPKSGERVFSQWKGTDSFETAWSRTLDRLRNESTNPTFLLDLRFHDLRHEATSRLFEKGLNVMEVACITGHKTLSMLQRYTHLRAEELALKLG